jgi:hypothetical protein
MLHFSHACGIIFMILPFRYICQPTMEELSGLSGQFGMPAFFIMCVKSNIKSQPCPVYKLYPYFNVRHIANIDHESERPENNFAFSFNSLHFFVTRHPCPPSSM